MSETLLILVTDESNIKAAYNAIKQELYVTGYPELLEYNEYKSTESLLIHLINLIWTLVKHRKTYVRDKSEKEQCIAALEQNVKTLQKKLSYLEDCYKTSKNEFDKKFNEFETMKIQKDQVMQELDNTKNAFQKTNKLLQSRYGEYYNRLRQKEHEIIELQKMLAQKIDLKRSITNKVNCDITSATENVQTDEGDQIYLKQKESLYKASVCRLENTVTTLVQENINLRNSIKLIIGKIQMLHESNDINRTFDNVTSQDAEGNDVQLHNHGDTIADHLFGVPGDKIVKLVEKYVCDIIDKITNRLSNQ